MSKADKAQVFQSTRIRTNLKGDGSWIHRGSAAVHVDREPTQNEDAVETTQTRPPLVRQSSYVLSTAMKFGSVSSPLSPTKDNFPELVTKSDSESQPNNDVSPKTDVQPTEAIEDPTESPATPTAQNGTMQPVNLAIGNALEDFVVEPTEQALANGTAEHKEDAPVDQSDAAEPSETTTEVSADLHVDPVEESSAEAVAEPSQETEPSRETEQTRDNSQISVELTDEPKAESPAENPEPQPEKVKPHAADQEPASKSSLEEVGMESTLLPAEELIEDNAVGAAAGEPVTQPAVEQAVDAAPGGGGAEPVVQDPAAVVAEPDVVPSPSELPEETAAACVVEAVAEAEPITAQSDPVSVPEGEPEPEAATAVVVAHKEVQCAVDVAVEQCCEPSPAAAIDHTDCPSDEIDPAEAEVSESVTQAAQSQLEESTIELADALQVAASSPSAVDVDQADDSSTVEFTPNQQPGADTNTELIVETCEKPPVDAAPSVLAEPEMRDGVPICTYCKKAVDGNIKITINYPPTYSHPECLKCGVCGRALGDMTTPMFLHAQVVHCGSCFAKTI